MMKNIKLVCICLVAFIAGCRSSIYEFSASLDDNVAANKCQYVHYDNLDAGIPSIADQIINREGYALGFSQQHKQPLWVTYRLTKDEVESKSVRRMGTFKTDFDVIGSAMSSDYSNSGYDRGHMAPAADMQWSTNAMVESFLMSNMCPQYPSLNRHTWAYLEAEVRKYAQNEDSIYVVSGPIFTNQCLSTIGASRVVIPDAFYKAIYDETPPEKMIAFVMLNTNLNHNIYLYATNVAYVESLASLNFFSSIDTNKQSILKQQCNTNDWISSRH